LISTKEFKPTKNCNKLQLKQLASDFQIATVHEVDQIIEGWMGKPKGVLQILYERGFIDTARPLTDYSLDGKDEWKDEFGEIFPRYLPFCLRHLLAECSDFKNEVTSMENLMSQLTINDSNVEIMYTPKYHCEIAGEGIEYSWG
jgi:hypothetical protein